MDERRAIRILLIEDNSGDALLLTEMLDEVPEQFLVERADRVSMAEEMISRGSFDLIMMDLNLPDCAGIEALHRIRTKSTAPIIIMSGTVDESMEEQTESEGAAAFLLKGKVQPAELHEAMAQALRR